MCDDLLSAVASANNNIQTIAEQLDTLRATCKQKTKFMQMAEFRGFRILSKDIFQEMQDIADTKSDICLDLLDGKRSGLIVAHIFAKELDTEKQRASVIYNLQDQSITVNEKNVWAEIARARRH